MYIKLLLAHISSMPKKNRVVFSLTTESFVIYRKKKKLSERVRGRERERDEADGWC